MKKSELVSRKEEHIDIALSLQDAHAFNTFDTLCLDHDALPDLDFDAIDISCRFLGRRLEIPFLISSMTGGPSRAGAINRHLAEAAAACGIALAVGSQRIAIEEQRDAGLNRDIRRLAPDAVVFANFGAAQLNLGYGADEARRAVDMIGADGLIIHLNPLQEVVQSGGDRDWRGLLPKIGALVRANPCPIIVKETGCGISAALAKRLEDAGVAAIDVSGRNGTNWAAVEAGRAGSEADREIAACFAGWGIPTTDALAQCRAACPSLPLIGSGGIRHGLDAAKAIVLGADIVGQAGGILRAALDSTEAVINHVRIFEKQLKVAMFCTSSANLDILRTRPLLKRHG